MSKTVRVKTIQYDVAVDYDNVTSIEPGITGRGVWLTLAEGQIHFVTAAEWVGLEFAPEPSAEALAAQLDEARRQLAGSF